MTEADRIRQILRQGEGLTVEFKEAQTDLPKTLFETICAFLNREGGTILLGVRDDGTVLGVDPGAVSRLAKDLVSTANSPEKLAPICRLFPEAVEIDGQTVISVTVAQSSQVHRSKNIIFDRSADGDFRVHDQEATRLLYDRKANFSTENRVIPFLDLADMRSDLFSRVRQMATVRQDNQHIWNSLSDADLLRSAGLWRRDAQTGREGYTLAAALLFGKNETILSALPYYEFDAVVRQVDLDRYDDRDYMQCNLLEAYDRLIAFVRKHLADPFFLEDSQRVSLRDRIFREVIVNMLAHREYGSGYPARLIIYADHVLTENANRTFQSGPLDPDRFVPYPKNPAIANVFREIGFVDRLGSGVRRVSQYQPDYTPGQLAEFIEGDTFRAIIPIPVFRDFAAERNQLMKKTDSQPVVVNPVSDVVVNWLNDILNDAVNRANVPVNVLVNESDVPVNVPVNGPMYQRLQIILKAIALGQPFRASHWAIQLSVTEKTIKRDLEWLRKANFIAFQGAPKTGRYVLTDAARQQLNPGDNQSL